MDIESPSESKDVKSSSKYLENTFGDLGVSSNKVGQGVGDIKGVMKDIEIGGDSLVVLSSLEYIRNWFNITQYEYFDRCKGSLCPYLCFDVGIVRFMKYIYNSCRRVLIEDNRVSNVDIYVEPIMGMRINKSDKLYISLTNLSNKPDLFGPLWINILTAGSIFSIYSLHVVFHNIELIRFVSLIVLFKLILLCLSCSILMGSIIFIINYYYTNNFNTYNLVLYISICGYTQIPLAFLCKIIVWTTLVMAYIPFFKHLSYILNLLIYFYLCISTSSTLLITLPDIIPSHNIKSFKTISILSSYIIQVIFLMILQSYTN